MPEADSWTKRSDLMYGYGYPYGFYFDPTYILLIIGMVLAMGASAKIKSTFPIIRRSAAAAALPGLRQHRGS